MSKNVLTFVLHPVCIGAKYLDYKVIKFYKKSLHAKKESSKITFGNHNSLCSSKPQICWIDAVLLKVLVLTSPWLSSLAAINIIRKYCSIHNTTNIWHEIFLHKVLKKNSKNMIHHNRHFDGASKYSRKGHENCHGDVEKVQDTLLRPVDSRNLCQCFWMWLLPSFFLFTPPFLRSLHRGFYSAMSLP